MNEDSGCWSAQVAQAHLPARWMFVGRPRSVVAVWIPAALNQRPLGGTQRPPGTSARVQTRCWFPFVRARLRLCAGLGRSGPRLTDSPIPEASGLGHRGWMLNLEISAPSHPIKLHPLAVYALFSVQLHPVHSWEQRQPPLDLSLLSLDSSFQ